MNKLLCMLLFMIAFAADAQDVKDKFGAIIRSDTSKNNIFLCFTGHDYYEGFDYVLDVLEKKKVAASFFLTGKFIKEHQELVKKIASTGHFVGAHSDAHLLFCDWTKRDSLLHTEKVIREDVKSNIDRLHELNIYPQYFMPPYEWYNAKVVDITSSIGQRTVNFSPGTRSNADYTTPDMANYVDNERILKSIYEFEQQHNMNGFHLLIHPGTSSKRREKLYHHLEDLITNFRSKGYGFDRF